MKRKNPPPGKLKFIFTGLFLSGSVSFAQSTTGILPAEFPSWLMNPDLYLMAGTVLVLFFVILVLAKTTVGLLMVLSKAGKKSSATLILLLLSASAFSQGENESAFPFTTLPEWVFNPYVYLFGFLFFILIATIYVLLIVNLKLLKAMTPKAVEAKTEDGTVSVIAKEKKSTFLRRVYLRLVDSIPVEHEKDILLDHDYDGIKELDNNLPPWWKYGFYATIVFGIFYLFIYHVSGAGKLQGEEYKDELALAARQKEERIRASKENVNEENVVILRDAKSIAHGMETYLKLCVACHRADGGGQVGPNLTDDYWIHGGGIKNVFKTITYGVPNKGMISWQSQLSPKQIQQVSSYILTLRGANPPGAKEQQGELWIEEGAVPGDSLSGGSTDSTRIALTDIQKQ